LITSASTSTPVARRNAIALGAIVVAAAALRFYYIDGQSYWLDESFTVSIVSGSLGHVLSSVPDTESTPHLYYIVAWLWAQVFGTGAAGLRSLSAVIGVATVPVAYLAAREIWSARAGLFAATLVAVNPYLIWYSQEARAYALLVLLSLTTVWLLAAKRYWWWSLAAVAALATHYFAAFVLVPEAVWLLRRREWRPLVPPLVAGVALLPLALHQRASGSTSFIADISFRYRLESLVKTYVSGEFGTPTPAIGALAALATAAGVVTALVRTPRPAATVLGLAAAAVGIPVILALAGVDYLLPRNVLPAYAIVALVAGAGMAADRAGWVLAAVVVAVSLVVTIEVTRDRDLQRADWRGLAQALGPAKAPRVVIVTPGFDAQPLLLYTGGMGPVPPEGAAVTEIDVIGSQRPPHYAPPPPPAGFTAVEQRRDISWELIRYRASAPATVAPAALAQSKLGTDAPEILIQNPGGSP